MPPFMLERHDAREHPRDSSRYKKISIRGHFRGIAAPSSITGHEETELDTQSSRAWAVRHHVEFIRRDLLNRSKALGPVFVRDVVGEEGN